MLTTKEASRLNSITNALAVLKKRPDHNSYDTSLLIREFELERIALTKKQRQKLSRRRF